ncbi:BAHD acyltransferase [Prunus yedoensis var. nudiflora]|uniref:BAHD acyltransferase n=1 Tax=Prunus yedoensis var. nudiflora TaxID=2094558 RepID=A0A314Z0R5_PRUYE|nr:BAHD acyltransferase [Prunus yedoensis var. nudiflora]
MRSTLITLFSLSEALTHFYLFAGEFVYNVSITCNDHGAAFLEAQVNCPISKILDKPDVGLLEPLLPTDTGCLSSTCPGQLLHKVANASTLGTFIRSWAAITLGSASTSEHVEIGGASSLFRPQVLCLMPQRLLLSSRKLPVPQCQTQLALK